MNKITAVIITRNEARNIRRCLQGLKTVADEIVVVDAFSTDDTADICLEEGARLIQHEWMGFGPQKNMGNKAATHDYILSVDADEVPDEKLAAAILDAKMAGLTGAYSVSRLNYYYGKFIRHGFEYPDHKVRLFHRERIQWDNRQVHERIIIPDGEPVSLLKGNLLHYTYLSFEEHVVKANRYTNLAAADYKEKGRKASLTKIVFSPLVSFLSAYFLRRGFLDGMHGFILAIMHAQASFHKYVKLWDINRNKK